MLIFKKLRYKNFLAVGDAPIELDLNSHQRTLIIGDNGAGKSSIIEALTFALFNKSYRGMNKPQLINSINNRDCMVELEFSLGTDEYLVRRGMKPNFFEIYKSGVMINQDAALRDQQAWFETTIIKMDFSSFVQIVVLGSALYTPFMMLNAYERRRIVENILGIEIFGRMFRVLKNHISVWKENYGFLVGEVKTAETEKNLVQGFIQDMQTTIDTRVEERKSKLKSIRQEVEALVGRKSALIVHIEQLEAERGASDHAALSTEFMKLVQQTSGQESSLHRVNKDIKFFENSDVCNICDQAIDSGHKEKHLVNFKVQKAEIEETIAGLKSNTARLNEEMAKLSKLATEIGALNTDVRSLEASIKATAQRGTELLKESESETTKHGTSLQTYQDSYIVASTNLKKFKRKHTDMVNEKSLQEYATAVLKDTGIKAQIIKHYIPIINHLVNGYLRILNFYVKFEIDENFSEIIKSRGRDEFTYNSFSMGERTRIDLALLFTWREVARMRNSLSTNLIIFDEIGDSSLDQEGFDCFFQIINKIDKANVFVISHREIFTDKFNNLVRLEKVKNFSRMVE